MYRALGIVSLLLATNSFAATSCPGAFRAFLSQFESDSSFQTAQIRFPLKWVSPNRAHKDFPDTPPLTLSVTKAKVISSKTPIFPTVDDQRSTPLERKIKITKAGYVVRFDKPDSDSRSIEFEFSKKNSCWQLVSVHDFSL